MTRADRMLIAIMAVLAIVAWPLAAARANGGADAVVVTGPEGTSTLSLHEDCELEVDGDLGSVTVRILDGRVSVVQSGCPDMTCVRSGPISAPGSVVACVPNGVVLRVEGSGDDVLDARIR
jgi:hypothetical protein